MLTPFVVSVVIILMVSQGFFGKLPTFDELENPKTNLATQLISSDGNNLGAYFYENRSNVSYKELPNDLIDIPNTYEFYWNTSARDFVERMLIEYKKLSLIHI